MKDYWTTLKNYLDGNTATKKSEVMAAWNTAVAAYEADEDVIEARAEYDTAKAALAAKFVALIDLEEEAHAMGALTQRKNDYLEQDCGWDFHDITHFTDAPNITKDFDGVSTFYAARNYFTNHINWQAGTILDPRERSV